MNSKARRFALVLTGGGVRGMAHVGVLRGLNAMGLYPDAIVGVSMGGIIAATYALNPDWYKALCRMDTSTFPESPKPVNGELRKMIRSLLASEKLVREMLLSWGAGEESLEAGKSLLRELTLGRRLEQGRIPVATVAMDLVSGQRVVFDSGDAVPATYASAAVPGLLPPLQLHDQLLADGTFVDDVPVDVARSLCEHGSTAVERVMAIDVSQMEPARDIHNGFQAIMRAVEICHNAHTHSRFSQADAVLKVTFPMQINILDFDCKRICIAAGIRAVRQQQQTLMRLLCD
jgi:NTE family protein